MQRIADNLDAAYNIFPIIADPVNGAVGKKSELWREQWMSLQFVLFVLCFSDIHNGFDYLSIHSQTTINTAPGFRTFYLTQSRKKIKNNIQSLQFIINKVKEYSSRQFDLDYDVQDDIKSHREILPNIYFHISNLLHFKYNTHELNTFNLCSKFKPGDTRAPVLTEEEYDNIFGDEHEPVDIDDDSSSDFDISDEIEEETVAEREQTRTRPRREGLSWRYYGDDKYLFNCSPEHEDNYADYWLCCSKCDGWICNFCIDSRKDDESEMKVEIDEDTRKKMFYLCDICIKSTTDVLNVVHKYTADFYDAYFGDDGVKSEDTIKDTEDYQWIGLSVDIIYNDAKKLNLNKNLMINQMFKDKDYITNNLNLLINHYNELRQECKNTAYEELFTLSDNQLYEILINIKKDIIKYIINQSQSCLDIDGNFKLKLCNSFKKDVYIFCNKLFNDNEIFRVYICWNQAAPGTK